MLTHLEVCTSVCACAPVWACRAGVHSLTYKRLWSGWVAGETKGPRRQLGRLYFEALPGACDPGLELGLGLHLSPGAPLQQKYSEGLSGAERWLLGNRVSDGSAALPPPPLGSVYPPGISSHPSASRIPETFVRVSRQFSETRARIARGCVPPRRVPRRCPGPFFGRRCRRCVSGVKLPQIWVVGVPKGSLLVQWTERTMSWGRGVEPARGRASRARWAHHLARSGEVESPGVPRPSANVLKE